MVLKLLYDKNNPLPNSETVDQKVKELEKMYDIWKVLPQHILDRLQKLPRIQVSVVLIVVMWYM